MSVDVVARGLAIRASQKADQALNKTAAPDSVSGIKLKTINNQEIVGEGDIVILAMPACPYNDGPYALKCINGTYTWVKEE